MPASSSLLLSRPISALSGDENSLFISLAMISQALGLA